MFLNDNIKIYLIIFTYCPVLCVISYLIQLLVKTPVTIMEFKTFGSDVRSIFSIKLIRLASPHIAQQENSRCPYFRLKSYCLF